MLKKSLFKPLWPGPSRRVTRLLFQLSTSAIVLTVSRSQKGPPEVRNHIKKTHLQLCVVPPEKNVWYSYFEKKKKILKHKYWTWWVYIVKVHKKKGVYGNNICLKSDWSSIFSASRLLLNFFENSNETKVSCESLV